MVAFNAIKYKSYNDNPLKSSVSGNWSTYIHVGGSESRLTQIITVIYTREAEAAIFNRPHPLSPFTTPFLHAALISYIVFTVQELRRNTREINVLARVYLKNLYIATRTTHRVRE